MTSPVQSGYTAASGGGSTWTPQDDRVDTEVSRITSAGGPLMQQAKTDGLATAQRRGLLNSSMAAGAAQGAVLNAALPMAQQNAAQTAQKNLSNQEYGQNRGLQEQKFGYDTQLSDQDFRQNSTLQREKFGYDTQLTDQKFRNDSSLSAQDYTQRRGLASQQGDIDAGLQDNRYAHESNLSAQNANQQGTLSAQEAQQQRTLSDQNFRQTDYINRLDQQSKEKIASWNVGQYEKAQATSALQAMESLYASEFTNIAGNADLPAEARNEYLKHIATLRDSTLGLVQQMYGVNITWASPAAPTVQA